MTVDYDSLSGLTTQFINGSGSGTINVQSLNSKLEAAKASEQKGSSHARDGQLGAFINQVTDITGESLTEEQAQVLIELAQSLMD